MGGNVERGMGNPRGRDSENAPSTPEGAIERALVVMEDEFAGGGRLELGRLGLGSLAGRGLAGLAGRGVGGDRSRMTQRPPTELLLVGVPVAEPQHKLQPSGHAHTHTCTQSGVPRAGSFESLPHLPRLPQLRGQQPRDAIASPSACWRAGKLRPTPLDLPDTLQRRVTRAFFPLTPTGLFPIVTCFLSVPFSSVLLIATRPPLPCRCWPPISTCLLDLRLCSSKHASPPPHQHLTPVSLCLTLSSPVVALPAVSP